MKKNPLLFGMVLLQTALLCSQSAWSADRGYEEETFFNEVPGTITLLAKDQTPLSLTTITADDIRVTPARNIYDLIQIYVPGASWVYHNEGPHPVIRGIVSDRNTKILLLVNGVNVNQTAHSGAVDELENWDLNDVKEIQIVRGPGAVTYGPGAIEGVINIITKDAKSDPGFGAGVKAVSYFRSYGTYAEYGRQGDKVNLYAYGSVTTTRGHTVPTFDVDSTNGTAGVIGQTPGLDSGRPAVNLMRDFQDDPQVKFQLSLDFLKEWKFWMRYNTSGDTQDPTVNQVQLNPALPDFNFERQYQNRYFLSSLEDNHVFSDVWRVKTQVDWHTYDHTQFQASPGVPNFDAPRNKKQAFSSQDLYAQSILNWTPTEKYEFAAGAGYLNDFIGAGWGRSAQDTILGDNSEIVSGLDNNAGVVSSTDIFVGKGWTTQTYSALAEANLKFSRAFTVLLSGRADKQSYTDTLMSPRVAVVSDQGGAGVYKLIGQQAERMNSDAQLLEVHRQGRKDTPERFRGAEFIWDSRPSLGGTSLSSSLFYNKIGLVQYNTAQTRTTGVGDLSLAGIELELKRQTANSTLGVNHSFVKQIRFTLSPDILNAAGGGDSGVSYADTNRNVGNGVIYHGTGNDLNNVANNVTKFFMTGKVPGNENWTLHGDSQIFWGYPGNKAALVMLQNAVNQPGVTALVRNRAINDINALNGQHAYDINIVFNASASWQASKPLSFTLFALNLFSNHRADRLALDAGMSKTVPDRSEQVQDPRLFGLRMDYKL